MGYFSGQVRKITFANSIQDFFILQMELDGEDLLEESSSPLWFPEKSVGARWVTVRGYFPGLRLKVEDWVAFEAQWKKDPKYGLQLAVDKAPSIEALATASCCAGFLRHTGIQFPGPPKNPEWKELFLKCMDRPEELVSLFGVSREDSLRVYHLWANLFRGFSSLGFLVSLGIPKKFVREILAQFGDEVEDLVRKDPWSLGKVRGLRFEVLDEIAKNVEVSLSCYERVRGAVRQCVLFSGTSGNLFLTTGELYSEVTKIVGKVEKKEVARAIKDLVLEGEIQVDSETCPGLKAIYEQGMLYLEKECTRFLSERKKHASVIEDTEYLLRLGNISGRISEVLEEGASLREACLLSMAEEASRLGIELSEEQTAGILGALTEPVSVITGLPGTGKTTSLSVLVNILLGMEIPILLIAPTAIAAKRMSALTGHPAFTIHRAFGAKRSHGEGSKEETRYVGITKKVAKVESGREHWREWSFGGGKTHPAKVVICDETSMIDQHLLYRILDCTDPSSRLVFVGDAAQLPSVGPGDVLRSLISSNCFPVSSLLQIFRQEDTSHIIGAAHQIFRGEMPEVLDRSRDFYLLPAETEKKASEIIVKVAVKLFKNIQKNKGHSEFPETFQVLSPRHRGEAGVTNLNALLRTVINPDREDRREAKIGFDVVREGDRIMVIENNYDLDIYNGDIGKISMIDRKKREVRIKIHGEVFPRYLVMTFIEVAKFLRLAYACTVHKYQGLEVDVVIMPLLPSFGWQLQRNLLYTAITRAKKKVILVGKRESLWRAIQNNQEAQRNTLMSARLKKALTG